MQGKQLSIFKAVHQVFAESDGHPITNAALYDRVAAVTGIPRADFDVSTPVGSSGDGASVLKRTARWTQQTLRVRGLAERVPGHRGVWQLTGEGKRKLTTISRGPVLIGFSSKLGVAVWADCISAAEALDEEIHLLFTSPPYALARARSRAYQMPKREEYVEFILRMVEAVLPKLADGGSVVLNLGRDIFESKSPARSLINERIAIALHDQLGLSKVDDLIWENPTRPPGPCEWACKRRVQLAATAESLLWFTNNPMRLRSDNRRVLEPHTKRHQALIARGGESRAAEYSDGAYSIRPGSFSKPTAGRIPRNVIRVSHSCKGQRDYKRKAAALGLPTHGAPMPERLAEFAVKFMTQEGDLCVDLLSGSQTLPVVAERLGRRWYSADAALEYVVGGGMTRFSNDDVWVNPDLRRLALSSAA